MSKSLREPKEQEKRFAMQVEVQELRQQLQAALLKLMPRMNSSHGVDGLHARTRLA